MLFTGERKVLNWSYLPIVLCAFLFTHCGDSAQLADKVCDCVAEADNNLVKLAKCYNLAQEIKENQLHTESQRKRFDKATYTCFGGGVLKMLQGK